MTWYKTGTVAVTPGSNAVLGTGTSFIANARVGDAFRGPDGEWYEVINIASNTALSIAPDYQGAAVTAGAYSLAPMQGYVKDSADALRAATQVIASGVADMQEQVAAATEAAQTAGQSKAVAAEQAGIASAAAESSTDNKDAAQLAAQQSQGSAQASADAAIRSETARDSIIQSEQAAADSAAHAEEVTEGKAASGDNNDITSLLAITTDGFDKLRQGIATIVGASASVAGAKGLVPAPGAGATRFLSSLGTWLAINASASWGSISGTLSDQTDLSAALNGKIASSLIDFVFIYPNGGSASSPANISLNTRLINANPFPGSSVICEVECLVSGVWETPGWVSSSTQSPNSIGVRSSQRRGGSSDEIVTQSGSIANITSGGYTGGSYSGAYTTAALPVRVKVWKVKS